MLPVHQWCLCVTVPLNSVTLNSLRIVLGFLKLSDPRDFVTSIAKLECLIEETIEVQVSNSLIGVGLCMCRPDLNLMDFIHTPL